MTREQIKFAVSDKESRDAIITHIYEFPQDVKTRIITEFSSELFPGIEITPYTFASQNKLYKMLSGEGTSRLPELYTKWLSAIVTSPSYSMKTLAAAVGALEDTVGRISSNGSSKLPEKSWIFVMEFIFQYLLQKESGYKFYITLGGDDLMNEVVNNSTVPTLSQIARSYVMSMDEKQKIILRDIFYVKLGKDAGKPGLFNVLDLISSTCHGVIANTSNVVGESTDNIRKVVLDPSDNIIADNGGQINLFGDNIFESVSISSVKSELLALTENKISEFLPKKWRRSEISFSIEPQIKLMIKQEISPKVCSAQIVRGGSFDDVMLIDYEGSVYALFKISKNPHDTYGISISEDDSGKRTLINISNSSEFSYEFVNDQF